MDNGSRQLGKSEVGLGRKRKLKVKRREIRGRERDDTWQLPSAGFVPRML